MTSQEEYSELYEITRMIRSDVFKKFIVDHIKEKQSKIKHNFFVSDLKESWRAGGNNEAMKDILGLFADIENDFKNKKAELESQD